MKPKRRQQQGAVSQGRRPLNETQKAQLEKRLKLLAHTLLSFVFVIILIYVLLFSSFLQIDEINLEGVETLPESEVKAVLDGTMEGKYLGIFSKKNYFLFPEKKIGAVLKDRFRKISDVKVEKTFPVKSSVTIKERDSLLVWCSGGPCYLIDENGYAYAGADFSSPDLAQNKLVEITDSSGKPVTIGEQILTKEYIDFALDALNKLAQRSKMEFVGKGTTPSRLAGEISFVSNDGVKFALSTDLPLLQTMKTLDIFLLRQLPENERAALEYLDLRFESRVYYKLKGQQESVDEQSGNESMVAGEEKSKEDAAKNDDEDKKTQEKKKK